MKKIAIGLALTVSTMSFCQQIGARGSEGGGGVPPAPEFAIVTKQGRFVDVTCKISAAGTFIISIDPNSGEKNVERLPTQFSSEIEDLVVASKAATSLGEKIVHEEGPTDAPVIEATVVDENSEEHIIYSRSGGEILRDKASNASSLMAFLKANCEGIL